MALRYEAGQGCVFFDRIQIYIVQDSHRASYMPGSATSHLGLKISHNASLQ